MNCKQFEQTILDLGRNGAVTPMERAAALAHLNTCPECAALQESWQAAREELRALAGSTSGIQAPARVEMRLRQEFRMRHRKFAVRRVGLAAAWALAAAAVALGAVTWINWQKDQHRELTKHEMAVPGLPAGGSSSSAQQNSNGQSGQTNDLYSSIPAEDGAGDFTPVPGALMAESEEAAIVRVRLQRGALGALGFPVNEESAGEWIQVDLLVGDDGLPQAVRLAR
jgi:anti-sigma factor RsiW